MNDAERALIARCKKGEKEAFDELFRRYERHVYNFAYQVAGSYDEAGDVAAETFVRVYNNIQSFRGDSNFTTWLYRVVRNVYLDERKRQRARPSLSLEDYTEQEENGVERQVEDPAPTPEETILSADRTAVLRRAIADLPEYQRAMIVLYHTEGLTYEEIAEIEGISIGTVKSRLNRARLALREKLESVKEHFPA